MKSSIPYRLIAIDIDGTLLLPDGSLSPRNVSAIHAVRDAGATVVLATSRRWIGAIAIAQQLDLCGPMILYDGAFISEYPSRKTIQQMLLAPELCKTVLETLHSLGWPPIVQFADAQQEWMTTTTEAYGLKWYEQYLTLYAQQIQVRPLASLCDQKICPLRIVVFGPYARLKQLARVFAGNDHLRMSMLDRGSYNTGELTIMNRAASKGAAMTFLATHFGIPQSETLAIGDGPNDISMLTAAQLGIAMGQAEKRVKMSANVITGANFQDGVAAALEKYVLHKKE